MKTCELNTFEASFTETAYWLAYFIFPIPIAMFMKRYSYKAGIIFGLVLAAIGGLLFFPAAILKEYWAYLCIFFIIATGMCFLETAANPYVTVLGAPETAPVSYTHRDVYKRQGETGGYAVGKERRSA